MHKKTFWPYGILGSIFAIVCACAYTIYYSLDFPVHMDNFYFDKYQNIENNYNEINAAQAKFDLDFKFDQNATILIDQKNNTNKPEILRRNRVVPVVDINKPIELIFDTNASNLDINLLLTRPHTGDFDKNLTYSLDNGKLKINSFILDKAGRWEVKMKLTSNPNSIGFYKFEFYAK